MSKIVIIEKQEQTSPYFINFRNGTPQFTFDISCKNAIKRWGKKYLKVKIDKNERIVEFFLTEEDDGFNVYHCQSWIDGVFAYGINSARLRDELLALPIEYQRLYVAPDEENHKFIYKY
jgi:hypothetical protein